MNTSCTLAQRRITKEGWVWPEKETKITFLRWNPVSDRTMSARFNSRYAKLTIIMLCGPINQVEESCKDEFYD